MGSVCSGSMAPMDAGVPLESPVAGIAMGLVMEGDRYKILSDILGDEDHLGDMDFKVAGTSKGITAIQMDIKINGLPVEVMKEALLKLEKVEFIFLEKWRKPFQVIVKISRQVFQELLHFKLIKKKIGALIGPGGKNIRALQENFQTTIECDEDGVVKIFSDNSDNLKNCRELIDLQINGPAVGSDYEAEVVTIKEYGAFVDIAPGVSGLVHVSEFSDERVSDPNDYVAEGDKIKIRVSKLIVWVD